VPSAEHDGVIQALASNGSDQPLDIRVLPRRPRGGDDFFEAEAVNPLSEPRPVDPVSIPEEILRRVRPGEGFDDLLGGPLGSWVRGDIEVEHASTLVGWRRAAVRCR
jgi:hypothetical protein